MMKPLPLTVGIESMGGLESRARRDIRAGR